MRRIGSCRGGVARRRWLIGGAIAGIGVVVLAIAFRAWVGPKPGPEKAPPGGDAGPATGAELYATHCAACHGEDGDGNGPAAKFLYPRPRNFHEAKFRLVTTVNRVPSDDDLEQVIRRGMPGSAMFSFGHLGDADRKALVGHVRHLTRTGMEKKIRRETPGEIDAGELAQALDHWTQPGPPLEIPADLPPFGAESVARGRKLYLDNCTACHGKEGKGDGQQDMKDDDGWPTRPRDYTRGIFKGGRDPRQIYARIVLGIPGAPMPPAVASLKPGEIGDMTNYVLSLADPAAQAKVEHRRQPLLARRVPGELADALAEEVWSAAPAVPVVVSPLWWREYPEPDLRVQAVHDGKVLAIRLGWQDATRNESSARPEDFEDMVAVQLFQGRPEPFLGMGAANGQLDLWHWRAGGPRPAVAADYQLDTYPFDMPLYRDLLKGKETPSPDFLTARAAGNRTAPGDGARSANSLVARGFGSTTFRPKESQLVSARSAWKDGRWVVEFRRPLAVGPDDGLPLEAGGQYSVAFALWDGAARDRNGQKLVSIWHDLKLE